MNFGEIVQKVVNAEAKASLKSSTMVRNSDIRCSQGHCPSHIILLKVQTQRTTAKEPRAKKSRLKKMKLIDGKTPALSRSNEPAKSNCKKKKREWLKKKDSTLAIGDNAIEGKKKRIPNNTSQITCYNCQKKSHFANKCPEPPKN